MITTERHGLCRPILVQFLLLLSSLPSTAGMTDRYEHNGPSRVSVPKHLNSWNLGTETTSLNFMTNQQDGPSHSRRTVVVSVTPHLVRLPHLPSTASLRRHLRTVISSVGGLFCIFRSKSPHSALDRFPAKQGDVVWKEREA